MAKLYTVSRRNSRERGVYRMTGSAIAELADFVMEAARKGLTFEDVVADVLLMVDTDWSERLKQARQEAKEGKVHRFRDEKDLEAHLAALGGRG